MNYTSIEQSEYLLELGLSSKTADMFYFLDPTPAGNIYIPSLMFVEKHLKSRMPEYNKGDIPCWSTYGLVKLLSKVKKIVAWTNMGGEDKPLFSIKTGEETAEYFDNIFDVIVWLLKEGYISNED